MVNKLSDNIHYLLYAVALFVLTFGADFAIPIDTIPDETAQLKNVYAMIANKSLVLQYPTQFSIWIHYSYLGPTLLYWILQFAVFDGSMSEFKLYVMENYQEVLPFLRVYTALVFLLGLILIRNVIEKTLNKVQANIFFIMVFLNLLIVINSHYSKFWMIDFGIVFISLYFYTKYKTSFKKKFLFLSIVVFTFGILSNYSIFMFGIYFILVHYFYSYSHKELFKEIGLFFIMLVAIFILQLQLGAGGHVDMIKADPLKFFMPKADVAWKLILTQFDYDFIGTLMFVFSLVYLFFNKNKKLILVLIPYLLNLFFISTLHYEPRYALFLVIDSAFIASFFAYYLYENKKIIFYTFIILFVVSNAVLVGGWLNIINSKDTRVETKEWIEENMTNDDFVLYNTLGFNYVALTKQGIIDIRNNFPKAISTRESLHLQHGMTDGKNGTILWKFMQAGYDVSSLISLLESKKYNIYLINEKFGKQSVHGHRLDDYFEEIKKENKVTLVKHLSPVKKETSEIWFGDVLYNFNNTWETIFGLKRSGPEIKIYKITRGK